MRCYYYSVRIFITTILLILYTSASTGASLYTHFCMEKMVASGMGKNDAKKCPGCGMEKTKQSVADCCKDQHNLLKIDGDQLITAALEMSKVLAAALPAFHTAVTAILPPAQQRVQPPANAPPAATTVPLYIQHCVFLV